MFERFFRRNPKRDPFAAPHQNSPSFNAEEIAKDALFNAINAGNDQAAVDLWNAAAKMNDIDRLGEMVGYCYRAV